MKIYTFANFIRNCILEPAKSFLCSFDISSLFTNVPLDETIEICANALYRGHLDCPPLPEDTFRELMLIATRGVEFSFNNQMHKQLDGVAMGSPLGRIPKYIWVDKCKEFHNKHLQDLLEKHSIQMYSTENEEKSSEVEMWNTTIKSKMWKQFTVQGNTQYLDMLPKILEQYDNNKNSRIKMTFTEASKEKNEGTVYFHLYGDMEDRGGSRLSHRSHMRQSTFSCTTIFLVTWKVFLICTSSNQL